MYQSICSVLISALALLPVGIKVAAEPPPIDPITVIGENPESDPTNVASSLEVLNPNTESVTNTPCGNENSPNAVVSKVNHQLSELDRQSNIDLNR
jgi:hypothetical protein